jgi:apolipoprotein D and lipocalin family protein
MMRPPVRAILVGLVAALLCGCSLLSGRFGDLPTAAHVDLARYMGHWRVIAHIPYFAEDGCSDSIESYALRPDGDVDNWFSCRKGSATAPLERQATARALVVNRQTNAEWNVLFFHVLKIKYVVLAVDPEYQWAAVGHPSRQYGWVFGRGGSLPDATYAQILQHFRDAGYDTSRFVRVPQAAGALEPPPFR